MIYATYSMVASDLAWMYLEDNVQPFKRLVEERVVREMKRHSSFERFLLRYRKEPFPGFDGFCVLVWEAYAE